MTIISPSKLEVQDKPKGIVRISKKIQIFVIILLGMIVGVISYGISMGQRKNLPRNNHKDTAFNTTLEAASEIAHAINKNVSDKPIQKEEQSISLSIQEPNDSNFTPPSASSTQAVMTPEQELAKRLKEQQMQDALKARSAPTSHALFDASKSQYHQASYDKINNYNVPVNTNQLPTNQLPAVEHYNQFAESQLAKDDHNKQIRKEHFLKEAGELEESNYLKSVRKQPLTPYQIMAGQIIPAVMEGGISSDLPGQIRALVRENVYDGRSGEHLLIPLGSKLLGTYDSQIAFGQERVLVVWNRVIFPDGSSINLKAMPGADVSGYAGFKDEVNRHYLRTFGSAMLMSIMSAGAQLSQPHSNSNGIGQAPSAGQMMAANLGVQLNQTGNMLLQKNLNIQPTLEIRPGYKFNIIATKDIVFTAPYTN